MAKTIAFDKRFTDILNEYKAKYDVDSLSSPNDQANLNAMIRNSIAIEQLQYELSKLVEEDVIKNSTQINRLNTAINELIESNMKVERQLSIDRKTRKQETDLNPADYIAALKQRAREFLNDPRRLIKVFCKKCQIMVGRLSPVYDTNEFNARFQCPQCKSFSIVSRKEKDIFFDIRDADWRRKHPIEIVHPKKGISEEIDDINDDVMLSDNDIIFE